MASALPPGGEKDFASQQEISNHFSDTKATGIRCRSEDEGLRAENRLAHAAPTLTVTPSPDPLPVTGTRPLPPWTAS